MPGGDRSHRGRDPADRRRDRAVGALLPGLGAPLERGELPPPEARGPPRVRQPRRRRRQVAGPEDQVGRPTGSQGDDAAANFRGARDMGLTPGQDGYGLDAVLSGKASPEVVIVADADFAAAADDPEKVAAAPQGALPGRLRPHRERAHARGRRRPAGRLPRREGRHVHERRRGASSGSSAPSCRSRPSRATWELLLLLAIALGLRRPQLDARRPARRRSRRRSRPTATSTRRSSRAAAS